MVVLKSKVIDYHLETEKKWNLILEVIVYY